MDCLQLFFFVGVVLFILGIVLVIFLKEKRWLGVVFGIAGLLVSLFAISTPVQCSGKAKRERVRAEIETRYKTLKTEEIQTSAP